MLSRKDNEEIKQEELNYQIRAINLNQIDEESVDVSINSSRQSMSVKDSINSFHSEAQSPKDGFSSPKNDIFDSPDKDSGNILDDSPYNNYGKQALGADDRSNSPAPNLEQLRPVRKQSSYKSKSKHNIKDADFDDENKKLIFKPKADKVIIQESKDIIKKINKLQNNSNFQEIMNKEHDSDDDDESADLGDKKVSRKDVLMASGTPGKAKRESVDYTYMIESLLTKFD